MKPLPKKVYDDTIAHYDRMIAWVKKQDETRTALPGAMLEGLGELWAGANCPICEYYGSDCDDCIIKHMVQRRQCQGTPWYPMQKASTWKTWLYWAYRERAFIRRLPHKEA